MRPKVIGLGAGGHAKVIIEALQEQGDCELMGLLDVNPELHGQTVLGVPVLGSDDLIPQLLQKGIHHFFLGVGSTGDTSLRQRLFLYALARGLEPINVIHPRAVVSPSAEIGRGACILAAAVLNADAHLGENVIVNTGAVIEHDCVIGAHVHVATGACLAGGVSVGEGSHVGIGASVRQAIRIGRNAIVGAGAVVLDDVPDRVTVAGVPARIIRKMQS